MKFVNVDIPFNEHEPLQGAFAYIQNQTNCTDIVPQKYVKVSVSSAEKSNWEIPIINKTDENSYFPTNDINGSWYEVDLLDNYFLLDTYVIRTNQIDYFKEWKILGSLDGANYFQIDHQQNITPPSEGVHTSNYTLQEPRIIRVFRYAPIGTRYEGNHQLIIHRLELFGKFVKYRAPYSTILCTQTTTIYLYYCLISLVY